MTSTINSSVIKIGPEKPLPIPTVADESAEFDAICEAVVREWERRLDEYAFAQASLTAWKARHSGDDQDAPKSKYRPTLDPHPLEWLLPEVYWFLCRCLAMLDDKEFRKLMAPRLKAAKPDRRGKPDQRGKPAPVNPFQRGLYAVFAVAKPQRNRRPVKPAQLGSSGSTDKLPLPRRGLTPAVRERLGKQMWQAYRHFVPPALINGFVLQIGVETIRAMAPTDIAPGFEGWIAKGLAAAKSSGDTDHRGRYSKSIRTEAKRHRRRLGNDDWN